MAANSTASSLPAPAAGFKALVALVMGGLAILENARDETAEVVACLEQWITSSHALGMYLSTAWMHGSHGSEKAR